MQENFELASMIIGTIGGSGLIILGLSNWLGKVWAHRLMESEKQKYSKDLESFKAEISLNSQKEIEQLKANVEIFKTKELDAFKDRLTVYRQAMDLISETLANLDLIHEKQLDESQIKEIFHKFNVERIKNRCYMSLICSPQIIQTFDVLIDEIIYIFRGEKAYCWETIRDISNPIIDRLRDDLALSEGKIRYVGSI